MGYLWTHRNCCGQRMDTDYLEKKGWRLLKGLLTGILIAACCSSLSFAGSAGAKKLNVKGLYIGMTLHDAEVIAEKFTDLTNYKLKPFNLSQYKFRNFQCSEHKYWFSDIRRSVVSPIVFATDANKRITFISIQGALVDKLFNSADHTAKQFVQEFSDMYNILSNLFLCTRAVVFQSEVYQEIKRNERELEKLKGDFENPLNDMNKRIRMDLKTHNMMKLTT